MSTTSATTVADLNGQTALVTGATSGIGKAIALKLAEHAATVLVHGRDAGRGVLLVSLELEEIRSLADRILVIYEGRVVGEFPPDTSEEELGVSMTGGGAKAAGAA